MSTPREQRFLIMVGVVGLLVGGFAGIAGGILVTSGRLGPLARYLPPIRIATEFPAPADRTVMRVEEESATIDVVRRASPAVVSMVVRKAIARVPHGNFFPFDDVFEFGVPFPTPFPRRRTPAPEGAEDVQVGGGTGFLVTSDGFLLTNRHVVRDADAAYTVVLADDREFPATVLAQDPLHDLAVLKITAPGPLPVLALGDSDATQIGETVIAIGYALSEFRNTVTKGVISGINRRVIAGDSSGTSEVIQEAIQTDAAINPGNSGGPLLNLRGEVIGVNTAVSREGQLVGFAIPINVAKLAVESVITSGKIVRPWLGVRYLVLTPRLATEQHLSVDYGALVVRGATPADLAIVPGSPADRAGIREHDIITAVDGARVDEDHSLAAHIARRKSGDRIRLTVLRQGKERTVTVIVGEFPAA